MGEVHNIRERWTAADAIVATAEVVGVDPEDLARWITEARAIRSEQGESAGVRHLSDKIAEVALRPRRVPRV